MNNLDLMREILHLIENISLFTEVNKQIFAKIISKLKSHNKITIKDLEIDNQLIEKINVMKDKALELHRLRNRYSEMSGKTYDKIACNHVLDQIQFYLSRYQLICIQK